MNISKNTSDYIFHHVVFPPMLPQHGDENEEDIEWRLDRRLHQYVQEQWTSFVEQMSSDSKERLHVISNMMGGWLEVDKQGSICKDTLSRTISDVKTHGAAALYVRAQNCGWIAYHDADRSRLIIDAFEVSPRSEDVLSAQGSLQRRFPGSSVCIPAEKVDDPFFCSWLSNELSRLYAEEVSQMMPKTTKAKVPVVEERDTVHPGLVTECLMTQLLAYGEHGCGPVFEKHSRDEVNWRSSKLPWRRSPHWFALKVAIQTVLLRLFRGDEGYRQYKNFMLYLVASFGLSALHVRPEINADHLFLIRAKVGRRVCKLKDAVYDHVAQQARTSEAAISARLQKIQQAIMASDQITVPETFHCSKDDLQVSLKNCGAYLRDAMLAVPAESDPSDFDRSHERRDERNRHGLPLLRSADLIPLADVESWVENMLEHWLRDREPSEHLCNLLRDLFQSYSKYALQAYAGSPDNMSEMLLTLLEIWVAIDQVCTAIDPRLREYPPGIPADFLESLLLPQVGQMQRAGRVETYIQERHMNRVAGLPGIFEDPAHQSFATRYFDTCDGLQQRRALIERHAQNQLQDKRREWEEKSSEYQTLCSNAQDSEHEWPLDHRGRPYHKSSCIPCMLERQASSMRIEIYEWPLPEEEHLIKTVVFELACPAWFTSWRDVTWRLVHDLGRIQTNDASNMEQNLLNYKEISRFAVQWGQRLTLGSKTKSWKRTHYKNCKFPVDFSDLSRPNAFRFRLLDSEENSWVVDQDDHPTLKHQCTFALPKGPYSHLQYTVDNYRHTENEVIADQKNCHPKVSLHEFIAFGCLRAGERVQWYNIIRELASAALSFNEESVGVLFRQAAWEMGTPSSGTCLREAHRILQDRTFVHRLLETLERRLDSIEANWNQHHTLHILVILSLRALSVSNEPSTAERAIRFLRRSRIIAMKWCEELTLALDDQTGTQSDMQQSLIVIVGGICHITYWVEPKHLHSVLHTRDDLYHLARSSIVVFENSPQNWDSAADDVRSTLLRTNKVLHSLEQHTRELIISDASGLVDAIGKSAPNLEFATTWEFCPRSAARWATNQSLPTPLGRRQIVHYNLLSGELLIDNSPPGRLPKDYTESPLFQRIFGSRILTVIPSNIPGSTFMSSRQFGKYQVHFGMDGNELVVKAQSDGRVLRLIPHDKLEGDFPDAFLSDYVHWLDENSTLEFRALQQMWKPCPRNWHLSMDDIGAEKGVMAQDHRTLVDIHGRLFQDLAYVLRLLDDPRYMNVVVDKSGTVEIELVRLRLRFFVNADGSLESRELNATVDNDQDIGCFYGLKNKVVLRDVSQPQSRSVLIPYGHDELSRRPQHTVVSVRPPDESRNKYFRYTLDPHLQMLRGPHDMFGTLYQAYLHALTGFVLPDPATGRPGTDEALRILRQEWLRTPFPLDRRCVHMLRRIASLTPQRSYYPSHLKSMQTTSWNTQLGEMAQHDDFRYLVQEIVDHANRFSRLYKTHDDEVEAAVNCYRQRGDQHLLDRARARHTHFRRSEADGSHACSKPNPSWYEARDRALQSDRSCRVFEVAALVASWPSSIPDCQHLFETIEQWQDVSTSGPPLEGYTCADLLHLSLRDAWGALYELCRSSDRTQDSYSLMSLFSIIVFGGNTPLTQLKPLLAVAFMGSFKDLPVPNSHAQTLQLHCGRELVRSELESVIEAHYTDFECPTGMRGSKMTTATVLEDERSYLLQKEDDIHQCVGAIARQWPCERPWLPTISRIRQIQAEADCGRLCTRWHQNLEFLNFVQQVQRRLNTMDGGPGDLNIPEPPIYHVIPPPLSFQPPDLFDLLRLSEPITVPQIVPPLTFRPPSAPQCYDSNSELESLIRELYEDPDSSRRDLGESLLDSFEALKSAELPCSCPLPDVRPLLLQYQRRLVEHRDSLWANIHASLLRTETHWQAIASCVVWPQVTVYSILALLAVDRWECVPEAWKAGLLVLAQTIASLQRSERLLAYYDKNDANSFFKEVESSPGDGWETSTHPDWLLFEIQDNLTIREPQVKVARQVINPEPPGSVVLQLNMGEGKTSVITPLVALSLARHGQLPRVIVLKPLLRQSINLLSQLGGMLNRRVYHVPFSRDTTLDENLVKELEDIFRECQARRGILVALPEHILSFRLIGLDLAGRGSHLAKRVIELEAWLQDTCRNLIDESDEVLDPKFQLVYTVGHQQTMDGHSDRWEVTQSLLTLLENEAMALQKEDPTCLDMEQHGPRYPIFHFLKDDAVERLIQKVFEAIKGEGLSSIPFTQWTRQVRRSALHFIRFTDIPLRDESVIREALEGGIYLRKLLVLRGLLAHQILKFAIGGKRWLVDYGLHPSRCLMAVPFRAKGVPSENSEFGHPDVAVVLTCLSYYYHGLTQEQVRHSFNLVTKENDPSAEYHHWVARGLSSLPAGLREITGVNLEDSRSFREILYPHLRYQKGMIDFYLSRVVFPREAKEFPHKLSTSAWDLPSRADQPLTTGFSGTNDNRSLLPQSAPQRNLPHLLHTNAMVLSGLLRPENRQCVLAQDSQGRPLGAHQLIDLVNQQETPVRVIIDVGAQILEASNYSIAQYWLSTTPAADGALFYDGNDEAIVVDRDGLTERLLASPFRHRMEKCLVFLDQQHARGVDLRLPHNYRAAVTLGPRLTKDRLVQACSRMRRLGNGQSVMFLCPPEVSHSMKVEADHMDSIDVIRWALGQTCDSLKTLRPLWASQGLQFLTRMRFAGDLKGTEQPKDIVARIQEPEARTLSELYAPWDPVRFAMTESDHDQSDPMVRQLLRISNGARYSGLHEEQERQISHEVQREQQVCRPPGVSARPHHVHKHVRLFATGGELPTHGTSEAIRTAFEALRQTSTRELDFPSTLAPHLYATRDFIQTVKQEDELLADEFLKPVHWVVSNVHNHNVLLLSQYEANELIPEIRESRQTTLHVYTPRTSKWMRPFGDLRFLCTGQVEDEPPFRIDNHELELFAGSLYFASFGIYKRFRHFLGLVTDHTSQLLGNRFSNEGFVDEQTRQEIGWPVQSPFQSNPLPFLGAILDIRSKGHGYLQTHIGMMLTSRRLTEDQF